MGERASDLIAKYRSRTAEHVSDIDACGRNHAFGSLAQLAVTHARNADLLAHELAELRALLATPWPEHLDEISWHDNGRGLRIVLPLGGEDVVFQEQTALAVAAGLIRAVRAGLEAKERNK